MAENFAGRSKHGAPPHARRTAANPILRVGGAVERTLELTPADLAGLRRQRFLDAVKTASIGHWPAHDWAGASLAEITALAGPSPDARWIRISGGPLASVLPIESANQSFIGDQLDEQPIPLEKGGPFRLISLSLPYNLAVKWVDTVELCVDDPDRSIERVAEARQRARDARSHGAS